MSADDGIVKQVEKLHDDIEEREKELSNNAKGKIKKYIEGWIREAQQAATEQELFAGTTSRVAKPEDFSESPQASEPEG